MADFKYLTSDLEALADLKNYYGWIIDEIRPFLGVRIAEVGGGIGTFTEFLVRAHLERHPASRLEVFEPASNLYPQLQEKVRGKFSNLIQAHRLLASNGYFHSPAERFDTVIMINVLEHIQDDREAVRIVDHALSPGGTFVVFVPALQRLYSALDRAVGHHRRYEKQQLEKLLLTAGFEVAKAKYMDCMGVLPWYLLNTLGGSRTINSHLAKIYDTVGIPATRWLESLWAPLIGKNILMVGRKHGGVDG